MASDLSTALTCTICKALFNSPVLLKCGHCYCRDCVPKLPKQYDNLQCKQCKASIYGHDEKEKVNETIRDLAYLYKMKLGSADMEKKAFVTVVVKKKHFEPGKEVISAACGLLHSLKLNLRDPDTPKKGSTGKSAETSTAMAPNYHGWRGKKLRFTFLDPDTRMSAMVEHVFGQLQLQPGTSEGQWNADKYTAQVRLFDPDFKESVGVSLDQRVEHLGKYRVKLVEK